MFEIKSFCFDVVMCDLVHDVRATHGLCYQHLELKAARQAETECREKMANKQNLSPFPLLLSFVVFFPQVQANCSFDNRNYEHSICVCMPNVTSTFK